MQRRGREADAFRDVRATGLRASGFRSCAQSTGDPWADEGFGGEDDWEGKDDGDPETEDEDATDDDSGEE